MKQQHRVIRFVAACGVASLGKALRRASYLLVINSTKHVGVHFVLCILIAAFNAAEALQAAAPVKLNGPLVAGGDVSNFGLQFSPDGSRILYIADQDMDGPYELFSVPSAGGTPIKLNGPLVAGGSVRALSAARFSPDGSRVLYIADQDTDESLELFIVPTTGGTAVKLNGPLVAGGKVYGNFLNFSADGSRVLYFADQITDGVYEIFSTPSTGGTPIKLNGPLVTGGSVGLARFSPDGNRVVYMADQDTNDIYEVFSLPSVGGTPVKLNAPLAPGGNGVNNSSLRISPDGSQVVYIANQITQGVDDLFIVPSIGGTPLKLNGPLTNYGSGVLYSGLQFSPDGSRVIYIEIPSLFSATELYSVPITGGLPIKLNGPLVAGGSVDKQSPQVSPDSSRVLYLADQSTNDVDELFVVPSTGGASVKLNGPLVTGGDVISAVFSPDGNSVLYLADQDVDEQRELYVVSSGGGTPVKLNGPLVAGGSVYFYPKFTPDGSQVVYLADQDSDEMFELYAVPSAGGMPVKLNGPLVAGGDVTDWRISPDGSRVLYRADQEIDEVFELYSVALPGLLPGDYNNDGSVDAADYTVWRDGLGTSYTQADYDLWRTHFGETTGSGSFADTAPVPEPSTTVLLIAALLFVMPVLAHTNPTVREHFTRIKRCP